MDLSLVINTAEFESFVNHYTACTHCKPRNDVYCETGRKLWIDEQSAFVANLETLAERQYWLSVIEQNAPKFIDDIKISVLDKFRGRK